jgi:hypothetical protein
VLLTACNLELELSGISDWEKRGCVVNSMLIGTGNEWNIGLGKGGLCSQQRAN